ncbi:uncharacterized protein DNG_02970 [Cephalotrichum gorgonifer]|uniref:Uncharacterized protein n=1 Tax=Cephalotrichum gorgonifer TaxID=2041049 RepID=A0AAE8ST43_9PEZI|nr:uncharacterized protein DNG_02970 [Cephalotrichum gorgonifer]
MATIEPRLIHLLNDATTPHLPTSELPPLQPISLHKTLDRLPPIEQDAGNQVDKIGPNAALSTYVSDDAVTLRGVTADSRYPATDRGPGNGSHSLRLLLGETPPPDLSSSLSKILSDGPDGAEKFPTKKRHRTIAVKDDFVQLPQPVKKQKATQQQVMPPIINGLLEPPPDAALFPPISSNSFNDAEANQLNLLREFTNINEDRGQGPSNRDSDKPAPVKARRRSGKPRKKWTETETRNLLLAVNQYGVGRWTKILEDPNFSFNDRTAGDLKDRFRTCCPDELRAKELGEADVANVQGSTKTTRRKAKSGLLSENILISTDEERPAQSSPPSPAADPAQRPKRTRAHRKKVEDLVELGIHGPFKQSHRRKGQPFTEQDDSQILEGLDIYGPAWTKIQREPRYNFAHRQPTDLRDRVRNKFPNIYQMIEKGLFQVKDPSHGNDLLEPSVNMTIENSLTKVSAASAETQLNRPSSRDEMNKWPGMMQGLELPELAPPQASGNTGEMDISRFLLDTPSTGRPRRNPPPGPQSRSSSPVNGAASYD